MKRTISIILIIVAVVLGVLGIQTLNDSGGSIEIGDLELSAEDNSKENTAYIYFGLCAVALIGGIVMLRKPS